MCRPLHTRICLPVEGKSLRIFVVEDHADTRAILVLFLTNLGHRVESAGDAGAALDRMRQDGYDVLLTDIFLPAANGWDMLCELKRRGNLPARVVTMSAMDNQEGCARSKAAGYHAHCVKPFRLRELEAALR